MRGLLSMEKSQFLSIEKISIIFIILFTTLLQGAAVVILNIEPFSDYATYMEMATSMLETGHMRDGQGNVAFYSAGWSLFLIPFFVLFGATAETVQYLNVILGLGSVLLVYYCAKEVLPNWKWALFAAFLWATYPPAILYTEYIAKENLMVPLLLMQILLLLKYPKSPHKIRFAILLGLIFSLELLVGPAVILTGAIIGLVITNFKARKPFAIILNWKPLLACLLTAIITLIPWLSYTKSELGTPVLNTNGAFNLYLGNNANAEVGFVGIQDTPIGAEWHSLRENKGEIEAFALLREKALDYILENPSKTAWLSLKKIAYFWTPPYHEGKEGNLSSLEALTRLAWLFHYCIIIILALIPLLFYKKIDRSYLILYGTTFLYCAIYAITYVIFRYRLPIMPIICILASGGLNFLYLKWKQKI